MKKILLLLSAMLLVITGCDKSDITLFPYNQVETTQAFNTEADVTLAVNGMYYGVRASGSYYAGTWNIIADVLADNLILNPTGRQSLKNTYYEWRYTGETTYGLLAGGYTITRRANAIMENIGKLPSTAFTTNAKGEALALRAMTYFDMSRVYSKAGVNAGASDLTLPYVTSTDPTITPAKESLKGFYDKVIADLVQAEGFINASNGVGRLNKAAVAGLLSRVYFYNGDYPNTIAAANRALGATPNLPNIATFPLIWTDATEAGVLFKVKMTTVDNVNTQGVNYNQIVSGLVKSEYAVDYSFMQLFEANDVRKDAYISTSPWDDKPMNHIIKYKGRVGGAAGVVDAKALRTAEVLLNRMEAEYYTNPAAALADLVLLKTNRYTGYVPEVLAGTALLAEIQRQRRLELAFEGDRFFDIKRRNAAINRDAVHGQWADGSGTPPVFATMPVGDKRFLLPFPQAELNFNKNFAQNPGY